MINENPFERWQVAKHPEHERVRLETILEDEPGPAGVQKVLGEMPEVIEHFEQLGNQQVVRYFTRWAQSLRKKLPVAELQ